MTDVTQSESPRLWSRRDLFLLGIAGFAVGVPFARRHPLTLVRRNVLVMGTIAEFAVAHADAVRANAAIDAAIASLRWVDRTMTKFDAMSDVGRANAEAAKTPVVITRETRLVLDEAVAWAGASNGAFDPCLGRLAAAWDVAHRHEPPALDAVSPLAARQLFRSLETAERQHAPVVRFHHPDVSIDLGGIAKGYAVDRAVAALRENGIAHALVGAGGDLYALGTSPSGDPWRIGIQSPFERNSLAGSLPLEDAAIATSGDYQQFFDYRGRRYHHLLDPLTGEPRRTPLHSVSVIAGSCMAADAGATLAFTADRALADRALARRGARIAHTI